MTAWLLLFVDGRDAVIVTLRSSAHAATAEKKSIA
jgi:hypothetical protein